MSSLTQNNTYTVALEWLFNSSKFLAEGTGLEVNYLTVHKHTHEQNKTHLIIITPLRFNSPNLGVAMLRLISSLKLGIRCLLNTRMN